MTRGLCQPSAPGSLVDGSRTPEAANTRPPTGEPRARIAHIRLPISRSLSDSSQIFLLRSGLSLCVYILPVTALLLVGGCCAGIQTRQLPLASGPSTMTNSSVKVDGWCAGERTLLSLFAAGSPAHTLSLPFILSSGRAGGISLAISKQFVTHLPPMRVDGAEPSEAPVAMD
jgi:hypothetical protein